MTSALVTALMILCGFGFASVHPFAGVALLVGYGLGGLAMWNALR